MMKRIIIILLLILLISPSLNADTNTQVTKNNDVNKYEFRGIKWGTDISELDDMIRIDPVFASHKTTCTRKNEKLEFGSVKVKEIFYIFYNGKLGKVDILFYNVENVAKIRDYLSLWLGKPVLKPDKGSTTNPYNIKYYSWKRTNNGLRVLLTFFDDNPVDEDKIHHCEFIYHPVFSGR